MKVPTRGSGMVGRPRGRGSASMYGSMMKRPAPGMTGINAKVPRMMRPVQMPNRIEQRLCRSCGLISPVGCKLADRPEILQTLIELTMTSIDLMKDQMEGFPGEVCKRCMISINNFSKATDACVQYYYLDLIFPRVGVQLWPVGIDTYIQFHILFKFQKIFSS